MVMVRIDPSDMYSSMGAFFGYPKCCIDALFDWDKKSSHSEFHGTGFVPCKECAKKPYDELLAEIQSNRVCKTPFPNGTSVGRRGPDDDYAPFTTEYLDYLAGLTENE
jgi:hypothetical protein